MEIFTLDNSKTIKNASDVTDKQPSDRNGSLCDNFYSFMTPEDFEDSQAPLLQSNDLLTALKERTTCTGLPHYHNSRGGIKKCWWSLLTVLAVVGLGFNLSQLVGTYLSYSFNVLIKVKTVNQLAFPAVTICNMCPIKKSKFLEYYFDVNNATHNTTSAHNRVKRSVQASISSQKPSSTDCCCSCCFNQNYFLPSSCKCEKNDFKYQDKTCPSKTFPTTTSSQIFSATSSPFSSPFLTSFISSSFSSPLEPSTFNDTTLDSAITTPHSTSTKSAESAITLLPIPHDFSREIEMKLKETPLQELIAGMDAQTKADMGFQFEDLVLDCTFEGFDCKDKKYFDQIHNSQHGNCFTFNAGRGKEVQMATKTGRRHGLTMVLNVNQFEYLSKQNDMAGIRLLVLEQAMMPFPDDSGVSLNPGQLTSLGLKQSNIRRLTPPHNICYNTSLPDPDINLFEEIYSGIKYGTAACIITCFQVNLIEKCKCGHTHYPLKAQAFKSNITYPYCQQSNSEHEKCMKSFQKNFNNGTIKCSCPEPCQESTYDVSLSTAAWPTQQLAEEVLEKLQSKLTYDAKEHYKENLVKVELFYEEFNFKSISEVKAYELFQFLSDCGGILGLWLGMSALTICEFVEFVADLVLLQVFGKRQRRRVKPEEATKTTQPSAPQVEDLEDQLHPRFEIAY